MSFRAYDYAGLDAQVKEIEHLVNDVEKNVQKEIERLEERLR